MSTTLRQKINNNKPVFVAVAIAVIVLAVAFQVYLFASADDHSASDRAFYTTDEGQTWFADDARRLTPFEHDGKQAVRAHLWKCDGEVIVSHLERYTAGAHERLSKALAENPGAKLGGAGGIPSGLTDVEFKRPGDTEWINRSNFGKVSEISTPLCVSGDLEWVRP